jgi:hypothetical protein
VNRRVHLNPAGSAIPAPAVSEAMRQYMEAEIELGPYEAEERHAPDLGQRVYAAVAEVVGAYPDEIALFGSATDA